MITPSTTTTGTHLPRPHQVVASLPSLGGPARSGSWRATPWVFDSAPVPSLTPISSGLCASVKSFRLALGCYASKRSDRSHPRSWKSHPQTRKAESRCMT